MMKIYNTYKDSIKEYEFRPTWNTCRLGYSQIWGKLSGIYRKYDYPKTYQEFYDKYVNEFGSKPFDKVAYILNDMTGKPMELCQAYIIKKVIVGTVDGFKKELEAKELMESKWNYTVVHSTEDEDITFGVDLFVNDSKGNKCAIQVKPNTFFIGNAPDIVRDRKRALEKIKKCTSETGLQVYYMIYDNITGDWKINPETKTIWFNPFNENNNALLK